MSEDGKKQGTSDSTPSPTHALATISLVLGGISICWFLVLFVMVWQRGFTASTIEIWFLSCSLAAVGSALGIISIKRMHRTSEGRAMNIACLVLCLGSIIFGSVVGIYIREQRHYRGVVEEYEEIKHLDGNSPF